MLLTGSLQLKRQHLTRSVPSRLAAPLLAPHGVDLRSAALRILGQPDPSADGLNRDAAHSPLHLSLRAACVGLLQFQPDQCAACLAVHALKQHYSLPIPLYTLPQRRGQMPPALGTPSFNNTLTCHLRAL